MRRRQGAGRCWEKYRRRCFVLPETSEGPTANHGPATRSKADCQHISLLEATTIIHRIMRLHLPVVTMLWTNRTPLGTISHPCPSQNRLPLLLSPMLNPPHRSFRPSFQDSGFSSVASCIPNLSFVAFCHHLTSHDLLLRAWSASRSGAD